MIQNVWSSPAAWARTARACLAPLSFVFGGVVAVRNTLYDQGVIPVKRVSVPVVSVGNLRVGGTGKTPFVIWLVEELRKREILTAVVSRGYGAQRAATFLCTAQQARRVPASVTARRVLVDCQGEWKEAGAADEALLVAVRTGAPVVTAADRHAAATLAEEAFSPDVIVLDDGFQHRRLARDIDIVLLGTGDRCARVLPAGPLRESSRALRRAHVIVGTADSSERFRMYRNPGGLVRVAGAAHMEPLERLRDVPVVAVSGIASNASFQAMLVRAGAHIAASFEFPDHYAYGPEDWLKVTRSVAGSGLVVTTEKDLVKLEPLARGDARLLALRLEVVVDGGEDLVASICAHARLDPRPRGQHDRAPRPRGIEA